VKAERLAALAVRLEAAARRAPQAAAQRSRLPQLEARLQSAVARRLQQAADRLSSADKLRASLDPDRPLALGFARVHHADGRLVRRAAELSAGEAVSLHFADAALGARIEGEAPHPTPRASTQAPTPVVKPRRASPATTDQGDLF
jgi:exodeoxyribonuclease VII large subunit